MILALPENRDHHPMNNKTPNRVVDRKRGSKSFPARAFSSEPVPFELSQSDGGCNAQIACYRDSVARHCFRVTADSQPRRRGGIGQRSLEIFQPCRVDASGPNRPARALPDYGILFVVGEKPAALARFHVVSWFETRIVAKFTQATNTCLRDALLTMRKTSS
jgi:hypothetical protein